MLTIIYDNYEITYDDIVYKDFSVRITAKDYEKIRNLHFFVYQKRSEQINFTIIRA